MRTESTKNGVGGAAANLGSIVVGVLCGVVVAGVLFLTTKAGSTGRIAGASVSRPVHERGFSSDAVVSVAEALVIGP
jgi:hypothetical protein